MNYWRVENQDIMNIDWIAFFTALSAALLAWITPARPARAVARVRSRRE